MNHSANPRRPAQTRRSPEPIFWALFGAGGMLSALIAPMLVLITGIAVPLGLLLPADAMSYHNMLALAQNPLGKAILLAVVALFFWHAAHRIFHSLHDLGIDAGNGARLIFYGAAFLATLAAAGALLLLGF
ncbi:fumarate reductase subunit FrdD [Rhodocyclus tenuis]|uniref:Fumarate reductase subunit D n=1 Tax=Rhodocyclus tenuis TaxID=1066 RepID=A0A840GKQ3_RHOTE|nr:fumarate reductase subunit FrdD [Rhodocyclus tenuis]MBB4248739.1 fumarate reductase subunit D [Rhodocyclus tenuis]